jgi:response regulator RpfG family c-di-GMP phosphodiesterase
VCREPRRLLLVVDYRMPGMSRTTLLQIAKATSPRTARMMPIGYPGKSLGVAAVEARLMHLIGKPWDDQRLKAEIRSLITRPARERKE